MTMSAVRFLYEKKALAALDRVTEKWSPKRIVKKVKI